MIIKFFSPTCGPCMVLEKNLQKAGIEHTSVDISTDAGYDEAVKYGVNNVPTLVKTNEEGKVIAKRCGILNAKQLEEFIAL